MALNATETVASTDKNVLQLKMSQRQWSHNYSNVDKNNKSSLLLPKTTSLIAKLLALAK